ncbi:30S ribosomal protein S9 [bacterium]|nr:MAG: 30S ribosomal protein S9 [bacterium]
MIKIFKQIVACAVLLLLSKIAMGQMLSSDLYKAAGIPDSLKQDADAVVRYSQVERTIKSLGKLVEKHHEVVTVLNEKSGFSYLQQDPFAIQTVVAPLKLVNLEKKYNIVCLVRGGGMSAQAEAIQLGIARAICSLDSNPQNSSQQEHTSDAYTPSGYGTKSASFAEGNPESSKLINNQTKKRSLLKEQGYLRRDSRIKERRKYGLKKARKAEQSSKR